MRVYLDTNILAFLLLDNSKISDDVQEILADYDNVLMTRPYFLKRHHC